MDFAVRMNHWVKIKENEKHECIKDSNNFKVTLIPIVAGTLETIAKRMESGEEELKLSRPEHY